MFISKANIPVTTSDNTVILITYVGFKTKNVFQIEGYFKVKFWFSGHITTVS